MMEAMQITVSKEIENRMDDSNSIAMRHACEPFFNLKPCVDTVIDKNMNFECNKGALP